MKYHIGLQRTERKADYLTDNVQTFCVVLVLCAIPFTLLLPSMAIIMVMVTRITS